tara:strand:- start:545 stop:1780 length:1236 start_codon:yes stop_codon:yes gene_type:complete
VSETTPHPHLPTVEEGAPPSNTAPANSIQQNPSTHILRAGIDSLYLSYPGSLSDAQARHLDELKERAKSADLAVSSCAVFVVDDHRFEVRDRGKGRFPYVLVDNWFHIQVCGEKAHRLPLAYVQLSSELITRAGWAAATGALSSVVSQLGGASITPNVSRVDICVDFTTEVDIGSLALDAWVTRANQASNYYTTRRFTGYAFGLGGDISARLYDKTEEIQKSKKYYLHELWQASGWHGTTTVWRLEFQFKRNVLKELGVETTEHLGASLAALWRYGANNWLRLTVPSASDDSRTRWPNHPLWDHLVQANWGVPRSENLSRISRARVPDDHFLFKHGLSGITSYMAREGISDFFEGLERYIRDAVSYHRATGWGSGADLTRYAQLKSREKARRYNTLSSPSPAPDAGAEGGE